MKIRKILCALGLHAYVQQYNVDFLRNERNELVFKATYVCKHCQKGISRILRFPKL